MPAHSVYRYYLDSRAKVRNQILPFFPRDYVTMKSGRGFHETCNKVYVKAFRLEMSTTKLRNGAFKYTKDEVDDMLPPQHWEFTKSPWLYGLMVKIYRRDPQLALDVSDVMKDRTNAPVSRAVLRRKSQHRARQYNADTAPSESAGTADSSVLTSSPGEEIAVLMHHPAPTSAHQDKLLWAKVTAAKAHAEATNIAKRMGKMEELEKAMALLDKMKGIIGEEKYASQVCSIFAAMPNFQSFDTAVDIVHVGSAAAVDRTPADAEWMTTTRRLSSEHTEEEEQEYTPPSKKNRKGTPTKTPTAEGIDNTDGEDDDNGDERNGDANEYYSSSYVLTEEDEAKYVTYHDITDATGKVIAIHAVDSRSREPRDFADNENIRGQSKTVT